MINPDYPMASWYLVTATGLLLVFVALPLLFAPLTWARWFGWKVPQETDLTVYLGRCLGGACLAVIIALVQGIKDPKSHPILFELTAAGTGLMVAIHVWGAIRRTQPLTETAETAVWAVLFILALWFRFSALA